MLAALHEQLLQILERALNRMSSVGVIAVRVHIPGKQPQIQPLVCCTLTPACAVCQLKHT